MTSIASLPRTAPLVPDFGFAQRRTLDHSAATDPTTLAYLHHHSFSDDQDDERSMLYSDFDAELAAAQNFVPDVGSTSTSTLASASAPATAVPAEADVGPVSSEFEFPEMPPALLEQAPEYEFSAHTRVNVFSDASLEALSSLGLDQYGMPVEPMPEGGISWYSQNLDVNASQEQAYYPYAGPSTATAPVLEASQGADLQGATPYSDLYGYRDHQQFHHVAQQRNSEPDATSYHRVSSSHGGDFSDTSLQVVAPGVTESPASFYADATPISETNSAHSSAKRRRTSPLPQQQGQGSPKFSQTNATNSPSSFAGALRQASSSQPHLPLSNGNGTSSQYAAGTFSRGLPSRSLPPAPTPAGSSGAGTPGQDTSYMAHQRPHRPFAAPQSMAGARPSLSEWSSTGPPRGHGPTPASTLGSSMYGLQGPAGRGVATSNGNAAASFYSQVGGSEGNFSLSANSAGPLSMTMTDLTGMALNGRHGSGRRSTTDSQSEDEDINAPPPNPKAVALAAAATKGQSGTQAQHDMLQALNETMSSSLEEHGVARCPFPNCTKTFAKNRSYNLKTHLRSHSQLKPFACASCPRAFSRKHDLERHARVHSGDKPYICEVCGRGFPRSDALRRHWRVEKECGDKASEIEAGQPLPSVPPGSSSILAPSKLPGPMPHHKFNGPNPYPSAWPMDDRGGLGPGLGAGMNLPTSHLAGTKRGRDEW